MHRKASTFSSCCTFFRVVEDLHLALLGAQQGLGQLGQSTLHGPGPHQKLARARLLHDLRPGEAKHLAEAFVAVDDPAVLDLGVGDQKLAIWGAERHCGSGWNVLEPLSYA